MADYLVTDTELVSIADAIRIKGGTSSPLTFPAGFVSAVSNIPSGGGSSYTLVTSSVVTASTSGTSASFLTTIQTDASITTADKIIYVKVRDKAGQRTGYFYGSDNYFMNDTAARGSPDTSFSQGARFIKRVSGIGIQQGIFAGTTGYGVYAYSLGKTGGVSIYTRYNSANSLTIDGTYDVEIYLLDMPDGSSPFA
mgnify:CR=1 FL=1